MAGEDTPENVFSKKKYDDKGVHKPDRVTETRGSFEV